MLKTIPPVRLDCTYLITAWVPDSVQHAEEDEHAYLSVALEILMRHVEVPESALRGKLKGQQAPVRAQSLPSTPRNALELWQSLKGRPRASLLFTLTVEMPEPTRESFSGLVREVDVQLQRLRPQTP